MLVLAHDTECVLGSAVNFQSLTEEYIQILRKWNKSINLVQSRTLNLAFNRHIEDSLQICDFLDKGEEILDIGSGAGLPGVILSICGFSNLVLCEKSFKKATFLAEVKSQLNLNFRIFNDDVYRFDKKGYTAVSRAFGSLSLLMDVMLNIGAPKGVFHKGEMYMKEVEEAQQCFVFDYKLAKSITNPGSVILIVTDVWRK